MYRDETKNLIGIQNVSQVSLNLNAWMKYDMSVDFSGCHKGLFKGQALAEPSTTSSSTLSYPRIDISGLGELKVSMLFLNFAELNTSYGSNIWITPQGFYCYTINSKSVLYTDIELSNGATYIPLAGVDIDPGEENSFMIIAHNNCLAMSFIGLIE